MNILLGAENCKLYFLRNSSSVRIFILILFGTTHNSCCCFVHFFPFDYSFFFPSWISHLGDADQLGIAQWTGRSHSQSFGYLTTSLLKTMKLYSAIAWKVGRCKEINIFADIAENLSEEENIFQHCHKRTPSGPSSVTYWLCTRFTITIKHYLFHPKTPVLRLP